MGLTVEIPASVDPSVNYYLPGPLVQEVADLAMYARQATSAFQGRHFLA